MTEFMDQNGGGRMFEPIKFAPVPARDPEREKLIGAGKILITQKNGLVPEHCPHLGHHGNTALIGG